MLRVGDNGLVSFELDEAATLTSATLNRAYLGFALTALGWHG